MTVSKILSSPSRAQFVKVLYAHFSSRTVTTKTDQNILKSPHDNVEIPETNITELIFSRCAKWDNLVATECSETGRKYSFKKLRNYSKNLAGSLRKKIKLNKGDVVGLLLPNCPEYALAVLGVLHGGLIISTFNTLQIPSEISKQLIDSDTKLLITQNDLWPLAKAAVNLTQKPIQIVTINTKEDQATPSGAINIQEFFQNNADASDVIHSTSQDVACLPYSSGTTGLPKGVELTHFNIVSNLMQLKSPDIDFISDATDEHQDVLPVIMPQFHILGLTNVTFMPLMKGCRTINVSKFDPSSFIKMLAQQTPDVLFVAPPLVHFMISNGAVQPKFLSTTRAIISGGSPFSENDQQMFINKFSENRKDSLHITQGYGMTETSPAVAFGTIHEKSPGVSIGPLVPNTEAKIVASHDANNSPLGPNELGEILVRGPQIMKGYHNRPKETEEVFSDGWLRTGDIGFYDDSGNLSITGRIKELIKVKGYQVPPAEIEAALRNHPDVLDAAVRGIPHERYGQVPKGYVVLNPGVQFNENKIQEFMKDKVAGYKQLVGGIKCVASIPKSAAGKILRQRLVDLG